MSERKDCDCGWPGPAYGPHDPDCASLQLPQPRPHDASDCPECAGEGGECPECEGTGKVQP